MNTITPTAVGILSHRLYLIWLAEGTDLLEEVAAPRAERASDLFYLRTGQEVLRYHVRVSQEEWERARRAEA